MVPLGGLGGFVHMSVTEDAIEYTYQNVSIPSTPSEEGVAYTYQNVGRDGPRSTIGRVVGHASPLSVGVSYSYQNVI